MVIHQAGGGVEVAGALQLVSDLMLQSITAPDGTAASYISLFPLNISHSDASFTNLRGKGGFVLSAAWHAASGRVVGPISVTSEAGGVLDLQLPPNQRVEKVTRAGGQAAAFLCNQSTGRFIIPTDPGARYSVALA